MSDIERLLTDSLHIRADDAAMSVDTSASAVDLDRHLDARDRIRRRRKSLLAVAAAVVVSFAGILLVSWRTSVGEGQPPGTTPPPVITPSPLSSASGVGLSQSFNSPQYRYTISFPAGWTVTAATRPWVHEVPFGSGFDLVFDALAAPVPKDFGLTSSHQVVNGTIMIASLAVPPDETDGRWLQTHPGSWIPRPAFGFDRLCYPRSYTAYQLTAIDGHPAWINPSTCNWSEAAVIVGHRAFVFIAFPGYDKSSTYFDRTLFERILGTVHFSTRP